MKHLRKVIILALACIVVGQVLLTNTSCKKREVFAPEVYDTILTIASPVDKVDETHDWIMSRERPYVIAADINVNAKKLQILTENPLTNNDAVVVSESPITDGNFVTLYAAYPLIKEKLYAALVDEKGAYTVTEFGTDEINVDFSNPLFVSEFLSYTPQPQSFVYGYEAEFPEPGDYDYNDIVLHISKEWVSSNVIQLNVQLAAVHYSYQLSAAVRLLDYSFDDIDSVKTVGGITFNDDVPNQILGVLTQDVDQSLLQGRNNEAVINLFADAHWATGDNLQENFGMMARKNYNVTKGSDSSNQLIVPRTISYLIYFKDGSQLNRFTLDSIDPFIMKAYNGVIWEVHLNEYRDAQTLFQYVTVDLENKHLPWALKVPTGTFRHPLKGVNIGFYYKEKAALFGAYSTKGHAFGTWSSDKTKAEDWYLYPNVNDVF
jgi:LruC domain-containing protein